MFSWGEGDDGKLGHGTRQSCFKPRQVMALRSRRVRDISAGSSHSAAITSCGHLYTWGLGEYGRLGHGDGQTHLTPKLVRVALGRPLGTGGGWWWGSGEWRHTSLSRLLMVCVVCLVGNEWEPGQTIAEGCFAFGSAQSEWDIRHDVNSCMRLFQT